MVENKTVGADSISARAIFWLLRARPYRAGRELGSVCAIQLFNPTISYYIGNERFFPHMFCVIIGKI